MLASFLRSYGAVLACTLLIASAQAQSTVDIGLYRTGSKLEVRVKPQSDFDGVVSNVVFAIRWEHSSGATLGSVSQVGTPMQYIPIAKSGALNEAGPFLYQVYAGFGMQPMSSLDARWEAGEEYTIATIPINGNAEFELVNDTWTRKVSSNANYYVSLGGEDRTGEIYKSLVSTTDLVQFSIAPNPNRGQFTLTLPLAAGEDVWFEIVNSAGQMVHTERPNTDGTSYRKDMDLSSFGAGAYHLRIHRGDETEVHKIVVN